MAFGDLFRLLGSPRTLVPFSRGILAARRREWGLARLAFAAVVQRNPRLFQGWMQLGHAARLGWDFRAAEGAYRQAIALRPRHFAGHAYLGGVLNRLDRPDEAMGGLREAVRLAPRRADPHYHLGRLLHQHGQVAPALESMRAAAALAPRRTDIARGVARLDRQMALEGYDGSQAPPPLRALRNVMIGTTGLCNASCIHCPTNKPETGAAPRNAMPMPLFAALVRQMRELGLVVTDQVSFGLFGDGLVDPHVVERARLLRRAMPGTRLIVNTNGAAFNRRKHAALKPLVTAISLHVESLRPETYGRLMAPLRLERVLPKCDELLECFPGKVHVSVPVSRLNLDELPAIRAYFEARGAARVEFDPLSSRCREDQRLFRQLALDPQPIRCGPDALDDLVVDCDGAVLVCCQDFARREVIGKLGEVPLESLLHNLPREKVRARFARGEHLAMETCRRCHADLRETLPAMLAGPEARIAAGG